MTNGHRSARLLVSLSKTKPCQFSSFTSLLTRLNRTCIYKSWVWGSVTNVNFHNSTEMLLLLSVRNRVWQRSILLGQRWCPADHNVDDAGPTEHTGTSVSRSSRPYRQRCMPGSTPFLPLPRPCYRSICRHARVTDWCLARPPGVCPCVVDPLLIKITHVHAGTVSEWMIETCTDWHEPSQCAVDCHSDVRVSEHATHLRHPRSRSASATDPYAIVIVPPCY